MADNTTLEEEADSHMAVAAEDTTTSKVGTVEAAGRLHLDDSGMTCDYS